MGGSRKPSGHDEKGWGSLSWGLRPFATLGDEQEEEVCACSTGSVWECCAAWNRRAGAVGRERRPVVRVAPEVLDGLDTVRESEQARMSDRARVVSLCFELGYPEAAHWVQENPAEYSQGIIHGFEEEWRGGDE